jgi:uncharacterized protein
MPQPRKSSRDTGNIPAGSLEQPGGRTNVETVSGSVADGFTQETSGAMGCPDHERHMQRSMRGSQTMAGKFEVVEVDKEGFKFRLTDGEGNVIAVSPQFKTISGVINGINALREAAATGIVVDRREPRPQN